MKYPYIYVEKQMYKSMSMGGHGPLGHPWPLATPMWVDHLPWWKNVDQKIPAQLCPELFDS